MRIIAGKYKKTPLLTLDGDLTRPTRDMVKEALFSTLMIDSDDVVLDLFSGSGAIGLESLSRGAKEAIFNDYNYDAVKIIKSNLSKLKENRIVYNLGYEDCLLKVKGISFTFIYIDPPYVFNEYNKILELIDIYNLLSLKGTIVIEVRKDINLDESISSFKLIKTKIYGINKLLYYTR